MLHNWLIDGLLQVSGLHIHATHRPAVQDSSSFAGHAQPISDQHHMHSSIIDNGRMQTTPGDQSADTVMHTEAAGDTEGSSGSVAAMQAASAAYRGTMQGQGPSIGERMSQTQAAWQASAPGQALPAAWGIPKGPSVSGYTMPGVASYSKHFQGFTEKKQQQQGEQQGVHAADAHGAQQQHLQQLRPGPTQRPTGLHSQDWQHLPQPQGEQQQRQQQQPQHQQLQHQQQQPDDSLTQGKHPVDDRVLEWCSRAEQLLPQRPAVQQDPARLSALAEIKAGLGLQSGLVAFLPYQGISEALLAVVLFLI